MRTFLLLFAFFSSYYSYAQISAWQEIREKMKNGEKMLNRENRKDLISEPTPNLIPEADSILVSKPESDLIPEPDPDLVVPPETWDTDIDSLMNSWHITRQTDKLNHEGYRENVQTSDAVYMERLSKLPTIIELPYNATVRKCIELYVDRRRSLVENMLGLEAFYFPMIEETLDKYDLPQELKYLVIIESAMNPVALSRAGASGLWQFMMATGRMYGLEINNLIDERRDPIKSTDAACRHLRDLYDRYGDWNLAIAAYNCGAGNVNKAISRSGGRRDYWTIYPYLPAETRSYVPLFIAANYVMNYYAYHQLYPEQTSLPLSTDTVMVNRMIHFDQIADILKIDKETIRLLNPQYKRDIIPGNYRPQILKLPTTQAYAYVEKEHEIATYRVDELFTNRIYVEEIPTFNRGDHGNYGNYGDRGHHGNRGERITHRVSKGESVITIANKYGVSILSVLRWNNLKSGKVAVGKNLVLYVDNGGYSTRGTGGSKSGSRSRSASFSSTELQKSKSSTDRDFLSVDIVRYKVQPGDSFYTIAQKYPGYSPSDLMKLNNRTNATLKVGQYIVVPKV